MSEPAPIAAPIIVTALFGTADHGWLDGLRRTHFPPERNQLAAHLTLFHHLPPTALPELSRRLAEAIAQPRPAATLSGPMSLGRGVALRVACPALTAIRADLAEAFAELLTPQDRAGWRAHVTIQNKVDSAAARALMTEMETLAWPRPVTIAGLACWWYRGGPWEPIRSWRFR